MRLKEHDKELTIEVVGTRREFKILKELFKWDLTIAEAVKHKPYFEDITELHQVMNDVRRALKGVLNED